MPGLFHILSVGADAMQASRQGVDTTGHNISNAQVEGYSRQRVNISPREPLEARSLVIGNGTMLRGIERSHDKFIEDQINVNNQEAGASAAKYDGLKSLENIFSPELNASVADGLTNFFNAAQDVANFPEDLTTRTALREAGENVCNTFHRVDDGLRQSQLDLNEQIHDETKSINDLLSGIATLNQHIREVEGGALSEANDLRDQRDKLVRDLSQKIDINYYDDQNGMVCIRGPKQMTLVEGRHSAQLLCRRNEENDGLYDVAITDYEGHTERVATDAIAGGKLKALVELRDQTCSELIKNNNEMATRFVNRVNEIHRQGFGLGDYEESRGRDFFTAISDPRHAARDMGVASEIMASTDAISVASTPDAPGDNVVANRLVRVKDEALFNEGRSTLNDYYSNYVGDFGLKVQQAEHVRDADKVLAADLKARREAVAGVSLDEEAMNLMKWQQSFAASAKVITTADELIETVLGLKR